MKTLTRNFAIVSLIAVLVAVIACADSFSGGGSGSGGGASITQGTFATLPATCTTNDLYYQTDGLYQFRCSSTNTWTAFLPGWGQVTVPPSAGWTSANISTTTVDSTNGYRYFSGIPTNGAVNALRGQYRAAPTAPYAITMGIKHRSAGLSTGTHSETIGFGVGFSDATKYVYMMSFFNDGSASAVGSIEVDNWTNTTTIGTNVFTTSGTNLGANHGQSFESDVLGRDPSWYCISDDGTTNLTFSFSIDRRHWTVITTQGRTAQFASGPTQIFWGADPNSVATGGLDLALIDYTVNSSGTTCQ